MDPMYLRSFICLTVKTFIYFVTFPTFIIEYIRHQEIGKKNCGIFCLKSCSLKVLLNNIDSCQSRPRECQKSGLSSLRNHSLEDSQNQMKHKNQSSFLSLLSLCICSHQTYISMMYFPRQKEIAYGTLSGGSTMTFFRDSKIKTYQQM